MNQVSAVDAVTTQVWTEEPAPQLVSIALLRALVEVVQQHGVAPQVLLGDDAELLFAEPAERWLSSTHFELMFARAVQLTAEPALGLYVGLQPSPASFGVMSALIGHAPTLRRALELVVQFHALLIGGLRIELSECVGVVQLRCHIGHRPEQRGLAEIIVAGLIRFLYSFGCRRDEILAVRMPYTLPTYHHVYARVFSGAERFAQDSLGVDFASAALSRPHLHHHAELHSSLGEYA